MPRLLLSAAALLTLTGCVMVASTGGGSGSGPGEGGPGAENVYLDSLADRHGPVDYAAVIADPRRPADEIARDDLRKPAAMLAFGGLGPGSRVADIRPEEGYFTRLFAGAVGEGGRVYAFVPTRTAARETPLAQGLAETYANVTAMEGALDAMTFPEPLDVVFMVQEYHDFHIPTFGVDVNRMNRAVFEALAPGGYYIVIDHAGRAGTGNSEVQSLHRIEGAFLRREVEAAGFIFDGESDAIRNPADDLTINVFDAAIRGRTDQFVYRFRKPG